MVVEVTGGTEYRLRVAGFGSASGNIVLNWNPQSVNDLFSDALTISGRSGQTTGRNAGAGRESGEPGRGTRSVWWKWRAPESGTAVIDTIGSSFDTTLGVYTGSRVGNLNLIAENDDSAGVQSLVVVEVTGGTEYRLRVAGFGSASGNIVLNWNPSSVNDLFSDALTISGRSGQTTGRNAGARESGEPGRGTHSVWWKWRAAESGTAVIDTIGSSFDTTLGVYTGSRVDDLNLIAEDDDGGPGATSLVVVEVTGGTEYRLRVAGFGSATGNIVLNWNLETRISRRLFVPVILSSTGRNNSFFTSEMTLTNRGSEPATLRYAYTAHAGGGSGKPRRL